MSTIVKICGITRVQDARVSLEAGADHLGFNFWSRSPRRIGRDEASEIIREIGGRAQRAAVAVFVDAELSEVKEICRLTEIKTIQLHGNEGPDYCQTLKDEGFDVIKAIRIGSSEDLCLLDKYRVDKFLLDARVEGGLPGGTGHRFDWSILKGLDGKGVKFLLAGGLNPDNVAEAVRFVHPYGVDTASGVESSPGIKDPQKVRDFIKNAKGAVNG